ncbi:MAG: hypothetical protein QXH27_00235 [Candidatus Micrarchaeia archaeon]
MANNHPSLRFIEDVLLASFGVAIAARGLAELYYTLFRTFALANDSIRISEALGWLLPPAGLAAAHISVGVAAAVIAARTGKFEETSSLVTSAFVARFWPIPVLAAVGAVVSLILGIIARAFVALPPGSRPETFLLPAALLITGGLGCMAGTYFGVYFEAKPDEARRHRWFAIPYALVGGLGAGLVLASLELESAPLLLSGSLLLGLFLRYAFLNYLHGK